MPAARPRLRLALGLLAAGIVLTGILAAAVIPYGNAERSMVRQKIIERAADILYPEALQQVAESEAAGSDSGSEDLLWPVTRTANQKGMLAVTVFDAEGEALHTVPASLLLPEIPSADFPQLLGGQPISHYHPAFPVGRYFSGMASTAVAPVLEVLLALHGRDPNRIVGFVQYYIYANQPNTLAAELAAVDAQIHRTNFQTVALGAALIAAVLVAAYFALARAQRQIAERNARLLRANFELALASKVSALGQITSHLIHGLQGPVAGLRSLTQRAREETAPVSTEAWQEAADYTARLQTMIADAVGILGDLSGDVGYDLPAAEVAELIRSRNAAPARERGLELRVAQPPEFTLDSRQGSLLSLIATNLLQNAFAATPPGRKVSVALECGPAEIRLSVADEGAGIPEGVQLTLFSPGHSSRPGGSGLGLAISRLLARQLGGDVNLLSTGPGGTVFQAVVPRQMSNSTITGQ